MIRAPLPQRIRALTIISVGTLLMAGCGRSAPEPGAVERQRVNVRVVPVAAVDRAERIEAGGVVAAAESAVVSSRVVAPVTTVAVHAGDRVRAGDVLVRLDAQDMTARVAQASAASRAAEEALGAARGAQAAAVADHKLATAWHGRIAQLRERNAATAQELDEADARLSSAAARAAAAQASVEQAAAQLASMRAAADVAGITETYAVLRAPFDGEVTERLTDPGNLATPGQPLLRIDAAGPRRVELQVDEARAASVRPGDRVRISLDEGTDTTAMLEGTVAEVGRSIAADQRAFTVKVSLPRGTAARTGAFARVRFEGPRRRVLIVPSTAVRVHGQLASVFVVSNGTAHIRLIQVGGTDSDGIEVVAGIEAGESVVDQPPAGLIDGSPVNIVTSAPGAAP